MLRGRSDRLARRASASGPPWDACWPTCCRTAGSSRTAAAGWAHALLFYGFLGLFIGTCLVFVHDRVVAFLVGPVYLVFSFLLEWAGLAFLAGVGWIAWRRLARQAPRLERSGVALGILALLGAIGVTGFLLEAARIAATDPAFEAWSFVGWGLSRAIRAAGWAGPAAMPLHRALWGFHAALCWVFFGLIGATVLRHMVAAPVQLALRQLRAPGRLAPAAEEPAPLVPQRLTWAQLLDAATCVRCGRCTAVCPATAAGKPLDPRRVVQSTLQAMREGRPLEDLVSPEEAWSCTTCAACVRACPFEIEVLDKLVDLRRTLVEAGAVDAATARALESTVERGNPFGGVPADRRAWAADLGVRELRPGETTDVLYWVGCAGAFDPHGRRIARATAQLLQAAGVDFAILGAAETCTGDPARRIGDEAAFREAAGRVAGTLAGVRFQRLVTHCAHCFNVFRNELAPATGGAAVPAVHHTQLLADLVRGRPPGAPRGHGGARDPPRPLLPRAPQPGDRGAARRPGHRERRAGRDAAERRAHVLLRGGRRRSLGRGAPGLADRGAPDGGGPGDRGEGRGHRLPLLRAHARGRDPAGRHRGPRRGRAPVGEPARRRRRRRPAGARMIALVLVHEGLDVSIDLDLREPGPGRSGTVGHRGGDRLVVTARADRAALEWALTLADRVAVVTVGPPGTEGVLAWALGRGAGRAVRIWDDALDVLDLGSMARIVSAAVRRIAPDVVVAGERGLAGATGALPALVAAHLGWPSVDGAIRLAREEDELVVERRLPGGRREELARPVPGRRHRGRGLRRAALRVDPGPAGGGAARPRDLVAGGSRSHGERRSLGGAGPRGPRGLAPPAATPDRRGGPGRPRSLGRRPSPPARRRRAPRRRTGRAGRPVGVRSGGGRSPRGRRPHHGLPRAARLRVARDKERLMNASDFLPADFNVASWFVDRPVAEGRGAAPAFHCEGRVLSYADVRELADRTGNALRELGVEMEQRVVMICLDAPEFLGAFWGAIKIGAVPVPVNTLSAGR